MPSPAYDKICDDFTNYLLRMPRDESLSGEEDDAMDLDASPESNHKRVHPSTEEDTDNVTFLTLSKK